MQVNDMAATKSWSRKTLPAIAIVCIAASLSPFALAKAGLLPDRLCFYLFFPIFFVWLARKGTFSLDDPALAVLGVQILTLFWLAVYRQEPTFSLTAITLMAVGVIYLVLKNELVSVEEFIRAYVLFIMIVLVFVWISAVLAHEGWLEPVPVYGEGIGTVYRVGLTLSNEIYRWGNGFYIRPSGIFGEPGQLGMHVTLALVANAVVLNNKRYERVLMILGLVTTSVGYYFSLIIFMIIWRRKKELLVTIAGATVVVFAMGTIALTEDQVVRATLGRMFLATGSEFGGNRSSDTLHAIELLSQVGLWGGGVSQSQLANLGDVDATFFGPFFSFGILGGTVLYLHLFLLAVMAPIASYRSRMNIMNSNFFKVFIILAISLYHRPFVLHFLYYLILLTIYLAEQQKLKVGIQKLVPIGVS